MFEDADEDVSEEETSPIATVGEGGGAAAAAAAAASGGAAAAETLPDMQTATEGVVSKGGNAAEAKARLLSMCKVSHEPRGAVDFEAEAS